MSTSPIDIVVSEVGPRDGLQNIKRAMPTETKIRWVTALAEAGFHKPECFWRKGPMAIYGGLKET